MIFTLTDRQYTPLGSAYETDDYLIEVRVGNIIKALDLNVLTTSDNAEHWIEGNYVMCEDASGYQYWFTIRDVEDGAMQDEKQITCYSGTLDIVNEDANPITKPSEPQPFEYYFNRILNDTGITIGINEISDLTRSLEFTSTDVSNVEMLQYVLNGFDGAEADLAVDFNGCVPTSIVLNVYKRIGYDEPQTILSDEDDSLTELDRTGSIADLATSLNLYGTEDDEGNPLTLVGKYYEEIGEDGNVLYYSPLNHNRIYSLVGRENFYVQLPNKENGEFDGYINRRYNSQASTQDALWREGLEQLKKIDHAVISYEAKGSIDCKAGDDIQIISHKMKPPVMISARVLEYKFNDDDPSRNEYVFGNYEVLESNIDALSALLEEVKKSVIYINSQIVEYTLDSQGNEPPTTGWISEPPSLSPGQWLWTRTTTNLSNGDKTYAYSVSRAGTDGEQGLSAYQQAAENGFTGTEQEWLESLEGQDGYTPIKGVDYFDGENGDPGQAGENAITGYLTNESLIIPATATGSIVSLTDAHGYFRVMDGNDQATSGITFSIESQTGVTVTLNSTGYYEVTAMSNDFGLAVLQAVYKGTTITKQLIIVKAKQGPQGEDGNQGEAGPPTGVYVSATVPPISIRYVGMLWRNTGASGYLINTTYIWNGASFDIYVFSAENIVADNLAALSSILGRVETPFTGVMSEGATLDGKIIIDDSRVVIDGAVRETGQKIHTELNPQLLSSTISDSNDVVQYYYSLGKGEIQFYDQNLPGSGRGELSAEQLISVPWTTIPLNSGFETAENNPPVYRVTKRLDGSYMCELSGQVKLTSGIMSKTTRYYPGALPLNARPYSNEFFQVAADRAGGRLGSLSYYDSVNNGTIQLSPAEDTAYMGISCSYICRGPLS